MSALAIYRALVDRGAAPALTLYGPSAGAPRLDLSGRVLANHAAKAANLLADDLMIDPGSTIRLDLPAHWRLITWALGGLLAGAQLSTTEGDTVVTTNPDADGDDVIVVSLGALDMSYPGDLPAGVIDGNAEALGQADILLDESSAAPVSPRPLQSEGRVLIVDPSPEELIDAFLAAIGAGLTLVVSDSAHAERAAAAEGAEPIAYAD